MLALQEKSEKETLCNILPLNTDQKLIYTFLLEDILSRRSLSPVEKITFLEKFLTIAPEKEARPILIKLGLKPHQHILRDLLKLQSLAPEVLLALHRGVISAKNAGQLLFMDHSDQRIITGLITELKLGGSKQRKLIEYSTELFSFE